MSAPKRLYRLRNRDRVGWWMVADDPGEALELSVTMRLVDRRENATIADVTDQTLAGPNVYNLADVLAGPSGIACRSVAPRNAASMMQAALARRPTPSDQDPGYHRWQVRTG